MAMSAGYILHTDRDWISFHRSTHRAQTVFYTRGPRAALKSLESDGLLVFLERNVRPHVIAAVGRFVGNYTMPADAAWSRFGDRLGAATEVRYRAMTDRHKIGHATGKVAILHVDGFLPADEPVPLAECGVESPRGAARGWGIGESAANRIVERLGDPPVDPLITDEELADQFVAVSVEGHRAVRYHLRIERNRQIVDRAKAEWLQMDPNLCCEVCGFSFVARYGERGTGFVEAHHRAPLGRLQIGQVTNTRTADLAPVCANCHRMLHRTGDIDVAELRTLVAAVRSTP